MPDEPHTTLLEQALAASPADDMDKAIEIPGLACAQAQVACVEKAQEQAHVQTAVSHVLLDAYRRQGVPS
jgi:hypothetical protein